MKTCSRALALAAVILAVAPNAHAYLDPGTGSMLIQGVIAAVAAAGVLSRLYWHRLMLFLGVRKERGTEEARGSSEEREEP
jgi:hypothetical protein